MFLPTTLSRRAHHVALSSQRSLCSQTRCLHSHSLPGTRVEDLKNNLRELFRNIAQPVAVVTSFMPDASNRAVDGPDDNRGSAQNWSRTSKFHGATLSSFTPIAMDPYPLVAFALRIPSRMATTLSSLSTSSSAHMVVNLLSAHQSSTAIMFSRPDLHPTPFESSDAPYLLSEEGLPVLKGVVGALSCKLVRMGIPLHDLDSLGTGYGSDSRSSPKEVAMERGDAASELFIARVVRVESIAEGVSPLVYHQRGYTTCPPKSCSGNS